MMIVWLLGDESQWWWAR